jgi:hypothetical protein
VHCSPPEVRDRQLDILSNDYGWICVDGDIATATPKGIADIETFHDFCFSRWA